MFSSTEDTQASLKAKLSVTEQGAVMRDEHLLFIERKKAENKFSIKNQRVNLMNLEKLIALKEKKIKYLQEVNEIKKNILDEIIQQKPEETKANLEKLYKDQQEAVLVIKMLHEERRPIQRELDKIVDGLNQCMWYTTILFKLSPSEWQKAQEAKSLKAEDAPGAEGTTVSKGVEIGLASCPETLRSSIITSMVLSCDSDTVVTKHGVENKEKLEMYFSDPQQVMDLLMELTDQVLSLSHNSIEVDKTLEEIIEITTKKMKEDKEKVTMQKNSIRARIKLEEERIATLKLVVQLHNLSKTEDKDIFLAALGRKVKDIHSNFVDSRLTNLNTLEKLCSIEKRMTFLLQQIENIPEEICEALWLIKDNEKKSRLREEKLRLEEEKLKEKKKRCEQRAHGEVKKITGRKLMPRSKLVKEKVFVIEEPIATTVEQDPYAELFSKDFY